MKNPCNENFNFFPEYLFIEKLDDTLEGLLHDDKFTQEILLSGLF